MRINRIRDRRAGTAALIATLGTLSLTIAAPAWAGFASPTNFAAGTNPSSVAVGDFNGDAKLDLAVANRNSANVSIMLGNGLGGITTTTNFPVASNPVSVAAGNLNSDTSLDLAVATGGGVTVQLGDGAGGFEAAPATFPAGSSPESVALGTFNADAHTDIAVATFNSGVSVLVGNGTGAFSSPTFFAAGTSPRAVAVGLFTDPHLDLAVANSGSGNVSVLLGAGNGGFLSPLDFSTDTGPISVAVGSFNGDAASDLAVANSSGTVSVLLANGGLFGTATNFAAGGSPRSVAVGDFNADGRQDLAVASTTPVGSISVLLGTGSGGFGPLTSYASSQVDPYGIAVGDFNGDGNPDLAVANSGPNNASIIRNAAPVASPSPSSHSFGSQAQATLSAPRTFTVTNAGLGDDLVVSRVFVDGTHPSDFLVSRDTCTGEEVPAAGTCQIDVRFAPSIGGMREAALEIRYPGSATSTATVPLSGTGGSLPTGSQGPAGPAGPAGAQGPPGRDATVTCRGKKRPKCTIVFTASRKASRASATLTRRNRTYARGSAFVDDGDAKVPLLASGALPAGRYLLTLKVRYDGGKVATTRRKVRVG